MRALLPFALMCMLAVNALAQQQPQLSQYMQNNFLVNPAVAGIESYSDVRTSYRSQWLGVEGAPTTFYASIHAALNKRERSTMSIRHQKRNGARVKPGAGSHYRVSPHHGVGAVAKVDRAGLLRTSSLNLTYAYHLPLTQSINLSSGVYTGFTQFHINQRDMVLQTPDDPFLNADGMNMMKLDLGIGLWMYSRSFFVGVSGAQLAHSGNDVASLEGGPRGMLQPHYYVTGGYRLPVARNLDITPSVMVKMAANKQAAVDVNMKALYAQKVWGGVSYRHQDAAAVMAGVYVNYLLDVSYSYDFVTSEMSKARANSHEVVVGFKLNNPKKVLCPQWVW
ncbi:type IX secretion system membrane protein PorP/SprF [Pontibacter sp. E15-1]|uniref:PorP/SprF family type IX secretion system membrane protein n=1 Tax=Pontibacter sp. E15-1 TaxID=2919918 RepID=UPI001F4F668F|nr:type IX secretion system membrane protein PorP/SprF [Pontibacter sp. E15-1]MCJ8164139.1 type IX secretion system membrane protein PorP/SprF [Pontibacter sp. E15-1]